MDFDYTGDVVYVEIGEDRDIGRVLSGNQTNLALDCTIELNFEPMETEDLMEDDRIQDALYFLDLKERDGLYRAEPLVISIAEATKVWRLPVEGEY